MPELLLEIFSEEIPARFQRKAADDLKKAVTDADKTPVPQARAERRKKSPPRRMRHHPPT